MVPKASDISDNCPLSTQRHFPSMRQLRNVSCPSTGAIRPLAIRIP